MPVLIIHLRPPLNDYDVAYIEGNYRRAIKKASEWKPFAFDMLILPLKL